MQFLSFRLRRREGLRAQQSRGESTERVNEKITCARLQRVLNMVLRLQLKLLALVCNECLIWFYVYNVTPKFNRITSNKPFSPA